MVRTVGVRADTSGVHQGQRRPELTVDYSPACEPDRAGLGERRRRLERWSAYLGSGGAIASE